MDLYELAEKNADVLRFSTLFTARQVPRHLGDEEGIERAVDWCRAHGITRVYLESFRGESVPPRDVLAQARDRFRGAGLLVSGCITPSGFGKRSTGWHAFVCFTAEETQRKLREMSRYAAGLFDEVMIDDFLCSDCTCEQCREAKGDRSWTDYKRELMRRLSRTHVIEAGREVNPDVRFIIKYPAWYEIYQERGYDVRRQSQMFSRIWVGTETRGTADEGAETPQYQACWLMRWLGKVGGPKCGGGWYDTIRTSPKFYVEQGRQTVLGGADEVFLFNFGAICEGTRYDQERGPRDMAALLEEAPLHFRLAGLLRGRQPRGLLGWKPPNSPAGPDARLHPLLGMAGLPVTASHEFDPGAEGFVFSYHVFHDSGWPSALDRALQSGRPVLATAAFLDGLEQRTAPEAPSSEEAAERLLVLPPTADPEDWGWTSGPTRYPALEQMGRDELNALRQGACEALGLCLDAPWGVSLHVFGADLIVLENFLDEQAVCRLRLEGWDGAQRALQMPPAAGVEVGDEEVCLPARSLVALRR